MPILVISIGMEPTPRVPFDAVVNMPVPDREPGMSSLIQYRITP
jgi:hypothetical protein